MNRRVVLAVNAAWNVANFRAGLVRALQAEGWEVVAMAPRDEYVPQVLTLGCRFVEMPMDSGGTHPIRDLRMYRRFLAALAAERPAVFLGYTIKPNVFGSLAAQRLGIPVINNIAGLGTAFIRSTWLTVVARFLYRRALAGSHHVLFQNEDDRRYFIDTGLLDAARAGRVPGSGVDLQAFAPAPLPRRVEGQPTRFLFVGRLLRDKGLDELAAAARLLRERGVRAEFSLLGFLDVDNRSAITRSAVSAWQAEGLLSYLGSADDVRPHIARAHCVVLPSYREGAPRTLLEAAAMGRPIIASDAVGCRDVVEHGVTGYLAKVRDAGDLAAQCERLIALDEEALAAMGAAGRRKMEREFSEQRVVEIYLGLLRGLAAA